MDDKLSTPIKLILKKKPELLNPKIRWYKSFLTESSKLKCLATILVSILSLLAIFFLSGCGTNEPDAGDLRGTLEGRVTNSLDGEPIDDVAISLSGPETRSEIVGRDGLYRFENVLVGTYTVTASHPLYETNSIEISLQSLSTSEGDIALIGLRQAEIQPLAFDFGDLKTSMDLSIKNIGLDDLNFTVESSEGWLSVDKISVTVRSQNETLLKVRIDRNLLDIGDNSATLLLNSPGIDSQSIPVTVIKNNVNKAILFIQQSFVDFGHSNTSVDLTIQNIGKNQLSWEFTTDQEWLSVSKVSGTLSADQSDVIEILADRTGLGDGVYEGRLIATSNGGEKSIIVKTEVIKDLGNPDNLLVPVGLRAYYTFNNGTSDDVVGNHPIYDAQALLFNNNAPLDGYYVKFDGDGDFIELSGNPMFNRSPGVVHGTISLWLRSKVGGALVAVPYESTNAFNEFMAGFDANTFVHSISNSSARACCYDTHGFFSANAGSLLLDDEWHHVALVYKGDTEEAFLFIDGQQIARSFYEFYPFLGRAMDAEFFKIGSDYNAGTINPGIFDFNGDMDNIRIYNRPLSNSEIIELYEAKQ